MVSPQKPCTMIVRTDPVNVSTDSDVGVPNDSVYPFGCVAKLLLTCGLRFAVPETTAAFGVAGLHH